MLARKSSLKRPLIGLLACLLFAVSNPLLAQKLKPGQAADIAQRQAGGKVLKVSTMNTPSGKSYQIKLLLPSGHITHVRVDGDTGKVLNSSTKSSRQ